MIKPLTSQAGTNRAKKAFVCVQNARLRLSCVLWVVCGRRGAERWDWDVCRDDTAGSGPDHSITRRLLAEALNEATRGRCRREKRPGSSCISCFLTVGRHLRVSPFFSLVRVRSVKKTTEGDREILRSMYLKISAQRNLGRRIHAQRNLGSSEDVR